MMITPEGDLYFENKYDGYGVFGGKDFYVAVAETNVPDECNGDIDHDRLLGIELECKKGTLSPRFVEIFELDGADYDSIAPSEHCEVQGFFYQEDEEEDPSENDPSEKL